MQQQLQKLFSFLLRHPLYVCSLLFLATLPFFAGKIIISEHAYMFGKYINYLHVRITLQTVLAIVVVVLANKEKLLQTRAFILFWSSCALFILLSAFTTYQFGILTNHAPLALVAAGAFHSMSTFLSIIAGIIAIKTVLEFPKTVILQITLAAVSLFQLILGGAQMMLAAPIFPALFTRLGQPPQFTSFTYIGTSIFSRAYGTTPHPNILAGILVLFGFLILASAKNKKDLLCLLPVISGIALTFSRAGIFALLAVLFFYIFRKKFNERKVAYFVIFIIFQILVLVFLHTLGTTFPTESFIASRAQIESLYLALLQYNPLLLLTGTGFTMSIPTLLYSLPNISVSAIYINQLLAEPPHNILLLLVVESGIPFTLCLLGSFFAFAHGQFERMPVWQKYALFSILCILGSVDHFLIY